jgi:hypothetical protein
MTAATVVPATARKVATATGMLSDSRAAAQCQRRSTDQRERGPKYVAIFHNVTHPHRRRWIGFGARHRDYMLSGTRFDMPV